MKTINDIILELLKLCEKHRLSVYEYTEFKNALEAIEKQLTPSLDKPSRTAEEILRTVFPPPTNEAERNDDKNIIKVMKIYRNEPSVVKPSIANEEEMRQKFESEFTVSRGRRGKVKYIRDTAMPEEIWQWIKDNCLSHSHDLGKKA